MTDSQGVLLQSKEMKCSVTGRDWGMRGIGNRNQGERLLLNQQQLLTLLGRKD